MHDFERRLAKLTPKIEAALAERVGRLPGAPLILADAMRYSVKAGGKRLRPALVLLTARALGKQEKAALPAACAIELLHTYSLIHDDLPAMDNDGLRRGRPTSHIVFGEACAILAGDALLTLAFEILAESAAAAGPEAALECSAILARAAGAEGMVGGQTSDIFAEGFGKDFKRIKAVNAGLRKNREYYLLPPSSGKATEAGTLSYIHAGKTGALLRAAVEMGAAIGRASKKDRAALRDFGSCMGAAFQITDDMLDVTADRKKLGKSGSDRANGKLTYVSVYGLDKARADARALIGRAAGSLRKVKGIAGKDAQALLDFSDFVVERTR